MTKGSVPQLSCVVSATISISPLLSKFYRIIFGLIDGNGKEVLHLKWNEHHARFYFETPMTLWQT